MGRRARMTAAVLMAMGLMSGRGAAVAQTPPAATPPPVSPPPAAQPPVPAAGRSAAGQAAAAPRPQGPPPALTIDIAVFHDSLAADGEWIESPTYGAVWLPKHITHNWRPYGAGRWVYTEAGWTWASDEPWGWATYHYGRWAFELPYGWVWLPGDEWGPAWVAWRRGGGDIGWAPLPPGATVTPDTDLDVTLEPLAFAFVREDLLTEDHLEGRLEPVARNVTIVAKTKNATRYEMADGHVVDRGVAVEDVEAATHHKVTRATLREVTAPPVEGKALDHGQLQVYRPRVPKLAAGQAPFHGADPKPEPPPKTPRSASTGAMAPDGSGGGDREKKDKKGKKPETQKALGKRHQKEREALSSAEAQERKALELQHRAELASPPPDAAGPALQARHEAENTAQREHETREWQALDWRQAREGRGIEPPPAPARRHAHHVKSGKP